MRMHRIFWMQSMRTAIIQRNNVTLGGEMKIIFPKE